MPQITEKMHEKRNFKIKVISAIPSFQMCRSKDLSSAVQTPLPRIYSLSSFHPKSLDFHYPPLSSPSPSTPNRSNEFRGSRKVAVAKSLSRLLYDFSIESPGFSGVMSKGAGTETSAVMVTQEKKTKKKDKGKVSLYHDDHDYSGCFSSSHEFNEGNGEIETLLFKSRSSSSDTCRELSCSSESDKKGVIISNEVKFRERRRGAWRNGKLGWNDIAMAEMAPSPAIPSPEFSRMVSCLDDIAMAEMAPSPAIPSPVLSRMVSCVDGKVKESMAAVVKKSEDPYEEFKRSMLEMIMEKQMYGVEDLEELLRCFLKLNSRRYHGVIAEAFSEIWEIIFCE